MTNAPITVYVKGTPRPQPRPRLVNGHAISTGSKVAKAYRTAVLAACKAARAKKGQIEGPVALELDLWFAYGRFNERAGLPHTIRPDGDNVLKLWQDCAQKAELMIDDSQVAYTLVRKRWSADAGALLRLTAFGDDPETTPDDDDDLGVLTGALDVV